METRITSLAGLVLVVGFGYLSAQSYSGQGPVSHQSYGSYKPETGSRHGGYSPGSSGQQSDEYQTETKYYYGGKYQGTCVTDGLYYHDDSMFVICSNGYPHEQPCPPGTKTSGSPKYQAGYYYGYTDLCSVNLVDYGYGPEYYAPKGYPQADEYNEKKEGGYGGGSSERANSYGSFDRAPGSHSKESYNNLNRNKDGYGRYDGQNGLAKKDQALLPDAGYPKETGRYPAGYPEVKNVGYPGSGAARPAYPGNDAYPPKYNKGAYPAQKQPSYSSVHDSKKY